MRVIYAKYGWNDRIVARRNGVTVAGIILHSKFNKKYDGFLHRITGGHWVREDEVIAKTRY